jgi:hypothetical protein
MTIKNVIVEHRKEIEQKTNRTEPTLDRKRSLKTTQIYPC